MLEPKFSEILKFARLSATYVKGPKYSLGANYNANCTWLPLQPSLLDWLLSAKIMNENMFSSEKAISTGHKKEFIDIFLAALYL